MHSSPFPQTPVSATRHKGPDMDLAIDLFISDNAEVCIFHYAPFTKMLSWLEYDVKTSQVDFIMDDGDVRNFGIPVDPNLKPYFMNASTVGVMELHPTSKKLIEGRELPLIIHA